MELLAIIVILAIIAVITIPIILNVVDNAKRGSVIDSAYGYKDAIHKFYVQELYEDQSFKL
ncbi:MAG: prepilin-type cleavage/methylation domain-containing protein, partial [Bacilli bacterium]|nr:prepilin-type cleavage/methylation domain-containing protein [Bacilli bacterium]